MRIECPHCFVVVIPSDEDRCPSCQGDVTAKSAFTGVFINKETEFPNRCHLCNLPTDQKKRIVGCDRTSHRAEGSGAQDPYAGVGVIFLPLKILSSMIFGFFSLIPEFLIRMAMSSSEPNAQGGEVVNFYKLVIKVPTCDNCKRQEIEPVEVRGLEGRMKIVVHNKIAKQLS